MGGERVTGAGRGEGCVLQPGDVGTQRTGAHGDQKAPSVKARIRCKPRSTETLTQGQGQGLHPGEAGFTWVPGQEGRGAVVQFGERSRRLGHLGRVRPGSGVGSEGTGRGSSERAEKPEGDCGKRKMKAAELRGGDRTQERDQ